MSFSTVEKTEKAPNGRPTSTSQEVYKVARTVFVELFYFSVVPKLFLMTCSNFSRSFF